MNFSINEQQIAHEESLEGSKMGVMYNPAPSPPKRRSPGRLKALLNPVGKEHSEQERITDDLAPVNDEFSKSCEEILTTLNSSQDEVIWEDIRAYADPLPTEIVERLAKLRRIPDHVQEARYECGRRFLAEVFLPRLEHDDEVSVDTLVEWLIVFKDQAKAAHPIDLARDFSLVQAVESQLALLHIGYSVKEVKGNGTVRENGGLVKQGYEVFAALLDQYPDVLYAI